jgi:arylsulfatase A-like enzyme
MYRLALVVVLLAAFPDVAPGQTLTCPGCMKNADCQEHYGSPGTCIAGRCSNESASCPLRCPACRVDAHCTVYGPGGTCGPNGRCSNEGTNCCATIAAAGSHACGPGIHSRLPQSQRNILFVLSDDIGYCHAGFMVTRGVCANAASRLCTTSADCSGAPCQYEISCRNREPGIGQDAGSFLYNRSEQYSFDFAVQTPFLDDLATHGAVFPRAHVAASTCTSSRQTFLTGRYQRHSSYLKGGNGSMEAVTSDEVSAKPAAGCSSGPTCAWIRAIPNELKEAAVATNPLTPTEYSYKTLGSGKTEFIANDIFDSRPQHRKKPGIGKFRCNDVCGSDKTCGTCTECTTCEQDLAANRIPNEAAASVDEITSFVDEQTFGSPVTTTTLPSGSPQPRPVQIRPFFVWYGPNIPHDGATPERFFREKYELDDDYDPLAPVERDYFARVSWMDYGVRTVAEHLQHTCTCSQDESGGGFSWKPLYDSTVVIYAGGDQGFAMPKAKHNYTENGHRMVLIVSEPKHRKDPLTARAFPNQFAATPDVLPTVLAYAGVSASLLTPSTYWYDYGRNLKLWIDGTETGDIRNAQYSEEGASNIPNPGGTQYMVNLAGKVGVCTLTNPTSPTGHKRPCLTSHDCDFAGQAEGPCIPANQPYGRRCINRPGTSCDTDADCAVGLCDASFHCVHLNEPSVPANRQVSYKEYDGADCSGGPVNCVPPGVCRPIMLKAEAPAGGVIKSLWDVNWTPDQHPKKENLLKLKLPGLPPQADPNYLGPCLRAEMEQCLYKFRAYDLQAGGVGLPPAHPVNCPTTWAWCP